MSAPLLLEPQLPRRAVAPHSSVAANENAIAIELVHVVHSWIADLAPDDMKDERRGPAHIR